MDHADSEVETVLVDLGDVSIAELEKIEITAFGSSTNVILTQVDRARRNMGTGPPGRVD